MSSKISVTFSPHLQDKPSIYSLTYTTIAALMPAALVGFYYYGFRALLIFVLSIGSAVISEALVQKTGQETRDRP